jgi:vacuolar-type H+-ATPase subunit E/Vma4
MPAEDILDHIKQTSDEEVKEILDAAAKEATAYITGQRGEIQKNASKLKDRLDKEAEAKKRLIIAKMRRDAAQKEFATKEALIKETFDMAWESLKKMSKDRYNGFLKRSLEAGKEATGTPCRIFCARKEDEAFFKSKDTTVEDPPDGYLKKQIAEGGGGFIIQSQDGSVTVDYTFKGIIERKMEPLRIGVAKILFAEE